MATEWWPLPYISDKISPISRRRRDIRLPTGFLPGFRVLLILGFDTVYFLTWPTALARHGWATTVYPGCASTQICMSQIHCQLFVRTGGEGSRVPDFPGPPQSARLHPTGLPPSRCPTSTGLGRGGPSFVRASRVGPFSFGSWTSSILVGCFLSCGPRGLLVVLLRLSFNGLS